MCVQLLFLVSETEKGERLFAPSIKAREALVCNALLKN
jgi:hypothetical protein